jgi:hypothetical protein
MACLKEKINLGVTYAAMAATGVIAAAGAETVVLTVAGVAAFLAAAGAYIVALIDLSTCLDNAGRPDDAAKLRQQAQDMQKDIDALKKKLGM